jgi:hypothetical protein
VQSAVGTEELVEVPPNMYLMAIGARETASVSSVVFITVCTSLTAGCASYLLAIGEMDWRAT